MNRLKVVTFVVLAFGLSACNSFYSDVTTFHKLPQPAGEKVSIVPIDPDKEGSLEFAAYAAEVGQELAKLGYVPAKDAEPDLVVGLDYTINDGREKISVRNGFDVRISNRGYWGRYFGYGFWHRYDPFFDRGLINDELTARTVYKATLNVEFRQLDGKKLYEGRAESENRDSSLPVVVPKLVEALFQSFPGPSGQTVRVVVEEDAD